MTPAESLLWQRLRRHGLDGLHFRRQHPFGPYILDFACANLNLCVELDGSVHEHTVDYDADRDEFLQSNGWTVMRFPNQDVLDDIDHVLDRIATTANDINVRAIAEFFAERKGKGNREEFLRILRREGGEPARPGDELPEGWPGAQDTIGRPARSSGHGRLRS